PHSQLARRWTPPGRPPTPTLFPYTNALPISIECDRHQFGQAMTNVLKNAAEAIEAKRQEAESDYRGRIEIAVEPGPQYLTIRVTDRKSTRLNSSHVKISYAVFCLKKKKQLKG